MKLFLATFMLVFLRALQQQNVIHGHYASAAILPFAMACAEVATVLWVVSSGWSSIPWIGSGGALGVVTAMYFHRKLWKKK